MRTCCHCKERFTKDSGFDTFSAATGGRVWICWPCYWKGLKTAPVAK